MLHYCIKTIAHRKNSPDIILQHTESIRGIFLLCKRERLRAATDECTAKVMS